MSTRRSFLNSATRLAAGLAVSWPGHAWGSKGVPISIRLNRKARPTRVPDDFIGLGYEKSSAAVRGLLSAENPRYVHLVRNLGKKGMVRIGGIVCDFSRYEPDGTSLAEPKNTVITRSTLEQLSAFLKRTGWTAIWSLNFAQGSIAQAAIEAKDVAAILGPHLNAIELGNEVENYGHGSKPWRTPPYTYESYRAEFADWRRALMKAVPGVRLAAPDTASSVEWVERMAQDADGQVQLLTTHYYRGGQKQGSAEQLIYPDPNLKTKLERLTHASLESGIPWRMCETNSFSGGGLPGVSDTMLGALWTLDYMLLLAQCGCAGVNIETGVNQLGFVSSYSPIQDDGKGINTAGAPYYGMLACAAALKGASEILPIDLRMQAINVTSYVCGEAGKPLGVVVVNRDQSQDARLSFAELGLVDLVAYRLLAPSPDSKSGVTLGGSSVNGEGRWTPGPAEIIRGADVVVPSMTAVAPRTRSHPH